MSFTLRDAERGLLLSNSYDSLVLAKTVVDFENKIETIIDFLEDTLPFLTGVTYEHAKYTISKHRDLLRYQRSLPKPNGDLV